MKQAILFFLTVMLTACANNYVTYPNHSKIVADQNKNKPKSIIVFLDGTSNTEESRTNVAAMHNLVIMQPDPNIHSIYFHGVGTEGMIIQPLIGMATGLGIGEDVRDAYKYLAKNYKKDRGDKLYIFGFSRGAYAARILAGLIYVAGIPNGNNISSSRVEKIYSAYKGKKSISERKELIKEVTAGVSFTEAEIEFMGLWDTVEALGLPNFKEDITKVNSRYVDQICNVKKVAHALSIDDNRARIFTPISMTTPNLNEYCKSLNIDEVVNEVWFSGAHADVGGGYSDSELNGVSFNWMLSQMSGLGITPTSAKVYEDIYSKSHDPSEGIFDIIYMNLNRDIPNYMKKSQYNGGKPKVHNSVFKRLAVVPKGAREFNWIAEGNESKGYTKNYPECFDVDQANKTIVLKDDQQCFDVVE